MYLGRPIRQMRPFPPTLNRQWGDFYADGNSLSNVGVSDDPSLDEVIANVLRDDFVFISLPPTLSVTCKGDK